MKKFFVIITALSVTALLALPADAAIIVVSVKGDVAVQEGKAWRPLAKGQALREGNVVSSGVNSRAVLAIDSHTLTIKPMTKIKILRNLITNNVSDNNIGLNYGSINTRVKRIGTLKTRFNVTTPVATSSVRGSDQDTASGPALGLRIAMNESRTGVTPRFGGTVVVGGRSVLNLRPGQSRPGSLLGDVKNKSLIRVYSKNMTDDEKQLHDVFGADLIDNSENATGTPGEQRDTTSKVTVYSQFTR